MMKQLWDAQQRKPLTIDVLLLGSSSLALSQGASESLAGRFELIPYSAVKCPDQEKWKDFPNGTVKAV